VSPDLLADWLSEPPVPRRYKKGDFYMKTQGSRILVFSDATPTVEMQLSKLLADIGQSHSIKQIESSQREDLVLDSSHSALVLLLTDVVRSQNKVLELLGSAKELPVLGLFSPDDTPLDQHLFQACDEVTMWPCSKQELEFRFRKLVPCPAEGQELGQSLFVKMHIIGNSPEFLEVLDKVSKIIKCDVAVLIEGETGTGKELIARAIHYLSDRKDMPFIAANCGAIPDQLFENEFFGHNKGAYTDAREACDGMIAQAEGGTLFLDEIETLSAKGQITLLRFLDNMMYRQLGGKSAKKANLRVITATNESISQLVESGNFRKDLYYRIHILNIFLPPLRERSGDISLLAEYFIRQYQVQYDQPEKELHPDTREAMKYYDWPGNVRELDNILHREFLLAEGKYISIPELETVTQERRGNHGDRRFQKMLGQSMAKAKNYLINNFEQQYLSTALDRADGNISKAARMAGKERRSFTRLLEKYELGKVRYKTH
jgi:DNA-binding NtrC family response regulator